MSLDLCAISQEAGQTRKSDTIHPFSKSNQGRDVAGRMENQNTFMKAVL